MNTTKEYPILQRKMHKALKKRLNRRLENHKPTCPTLSLTQSRDALGLSHLVSHTGPRCPRGLTYHTFTTVNVLFILSSVNLHFPVYSWSFHAKLAKKKKWLEEMATKKRMNNFREQIVAVVKAMSNSSINFLFSKPIRRGVQMVGELKFS